jgi:hypothetical protein
MTMPNPDPKPDKLFWFKPRFDPVIHLGHVISIVTFIILGIGAWTAVKVDISTFDVRLRAVEQAIVTIATNNITNARQDEKLSAMDRRVDNNEKHLNGIDQRMIKIEEYQGEFRRK